MARVENRSAPVQWDPFFGPPVRLGDGGMGWKVDKDPRSKVLGGPTGFGQMPDAQRSLIPNQGLRHYGAAPVQQQHAPHSQPYSQQVFNGAQGAAPPVPYYQGPPPPMLQDSSPSHSYQHYGPTREGDPIAYVPAPQHYYVASGQPPAAAHYAPVPQAYSDPVRPALLGVVPQNPIDVVDLGTTPRPESGKSKVSEEELHSVL
jgi:hypothetical protein